MPRAFRGGVESLRRASGSQQVDAIALIGADPPITCSGRLFLWFFVSISCIGGLLFGYDTGVISGASVLLQAQFELSSLKLEVVVSSTVLLAAAGSLCAGSLNSQFGRRPTILLASLVFTLGAAVMAAAPSFGMLVLGRTVVGLAVGLSSGTVPIYIAELAPASLRGRLVALNNVCIVSGQVLAGLVAGAFALAPQGWRWMLGIGAVPALVQLFGMFFLPESPRWLLEQGHTERARAVMRRSRPATVASEAEIDAEIGEVLAFLAAAKEAEAALGLTPVASAAGVAPSASSGGGGLLDKPRRVSLPRAADGAEEATAAAGAGTAGTARVPSSRGAATTDAYPRLALPGLLPRFRPVRKQLRLGVGLMLLQQLVGINTIMYYSTPILKQAFYSGQPHVTAEERAFVVWLSAPVACGQLIGCLAGMILIDRLGRRPLVLLSLGGCTAALVVQGLNFYVDAHACGGALGGAAAAADGAALPDRSPGAEGRSGVCALTGWFSLGGMVAYLVSFGLGMSPVPWALNAELYPLALRPACVGLATAANWFANFAVAGSFLSLEEALGPAGTFWLYGAFAALGWAWLWLELPETAGKSLEEIEALFR